ncbi:MAG: DNA mismatch repair endonuclease MutL [Lachnospiraceae bacterium]|nr:DNA mismatch repair endonuclease MutL [Lachnospiraceae bacterium]
MAEIKVLDQYTIDNIAAGEVVERPSSVVKELVENAVDAKANAITVEIKEGGIKFIRVTDNGTGIEKDQIPTAFLRHATSKIRNVDDLMKVSSLGFRGEALSSIAAVGQVELISKTAESLSGTRYEIHGGKEVAFEEIGCPEGTTFIVRNLFYNVPARRKFLKTAMTEASYIEALIRQLAMSHPEIAFKLVHNKQNKIATPGNGNLKDVIYHIFGRDIAKNLLECKVDTEKVKICGFIGKPVISRGNRGYENYFVNGRYIKSNIISRAIEDAYKTYNMVHKYPFTSLMIEVPMESLDVNVHPTKMEVRFSEGEKVYRTILEAVRQALMQKNLIPSVGFDTKKEKKETKEIKRAVPEPFEILRRKQTIRDAYLEEQSKKEIDQLIPSVPMEKEKRQKTERKEQPPKQPEEVSRQIKNEIKEEIRQQMKEEVVYTTEEKQISFLEQEDIKKKWNPKFRIIGQLFATYWLMELEDKFYIMDQHAAHEKVNYEKLMNALKKKEIYSQQLAPPLILSLSMKEAEVIKKYDQAFSSLGFVIEEFGGKEYCIRAVPANLYGLGEQELFIELLDSVMEEGIMADMDMITDKIATMSCKAAVKGNQTLSEQEAGHLLDELMKCENPYTCPHGRPTMISMTKTEIEKKFKRIV